MSMAASGGMAKRSGFAQTKSILVIVALAMQTDTLNSVLANGVLALLQQNNAGSSSNAAKSVGGPVDFSSNESDGAEHCPKAYSVRYRQLTRPQLSELLNRLNQKTPGLKLTASALGSDTTKYQQALEKRPHQQQNSKRKARCKEIWQRVAKSFRSTQKERMRKLVETALGVTLGQMYRQDSSITWGATLRRLENKWSRRCDRDKGLELRVKNLYCKLSQESLNEKDMVEKQHRWLKVLRQADKNEGGNDDDSDVDGRNSSSEDVSKSSSDSSTYESSEDSCSSSSSHTPCILPAKQDDERKHRFSTGSAQQGKDDVKNASPTSSLATKIFGLRGEDAKLIGDQFKDEYVENEADLAQLLRAHWEPSLKGLKALAMLRVTKVIKHFREEAEKREKEKRPAFRDKANEFGKDKGNSSMAASSTTSSGKVKAHQERIRELEQRLLEDARTKREAATKQEEEDMARKKLKSGGEEKDGKKDKAHKTEKDNNHVHTNKSVEDIKGKKGTLDKDHAHKRKKEHKDKDSPGQGNIDKENVVDKDDNEGRHGKKIRRSSSGNVEATLEVSPSTTSNTMEKKDKRGTHGKHAVARESARTPEKVRESCDTVNDKSRVKEKKTKKDKKEKRGKDKTSRKRKKDNESDSVLDREEASAKKKKKKNKSGKETTEVNTTKRVRDYDDESSDERKFSAETIAILRSLGSTDEEVTKNQRHEDDGVDRLLDNAEESPADDSTNNASPIEQYDASQSPGSGSDSTSDEKRDENQKDEKQEDEKQEDGTDDHKAENVNVKPDDPTEEIAIPGSSCANSDTEKLRAACASASAAATD